MVFIYFDATTEQAALIARELKDIYELLSYSIERKMYFTSATNIRKLEKICDILAKYNIINTER